MLFVAKCYWPGVTQTELEQAGARAARAAAGAGPGVAYLGSLLFVDDDLALCLFSGPSRGPVKRVSDQARVPWERLMATVWVAPDRDPDTGT